MFSYSKLLKLNVGFTLLMNHITGVIVNYFTNPLIIFNEAKHEYWLDDVIHRDNVY